MRQQLKMGGQVGTDETPDWSNLIRELSHESYPSVSQHCVLEKLLECLARRELESEAVQVGSTSVCQGSANPSPAWVSLSALELLKELGREPGTTGLGPPHGVECGNTTFTGGRSADRQREYWLHQRMFINARRKLAARILDG